MRSNSKILEFALLATFIGLAFVAAGAMYRKQMKQILKQSTSLSTGGW